MRLVRAPIKGWRLLLLVLLLGADLGAAVPFGVALLEGRPLIVDPTAGPASASVPPTILPAVAEPVVTLTATPTPSPTPTPIVRLISGT